MYETPAFQRGFQPGMVLARKFTLLRELATGGMGTVYEAKDLLIGRRVAIKLLQPEYAYVPELVRRFLREAQATAAIRHPNVVTIHEMGRRRDGSYYIVQELLDGDNLRERLDQAGRLDVDEALDVLLPVMSALDAAHRVGIIHRDVKPDNIVLARTHKDEPWPKLIDFGVAKAPKLVKGRPTRLGEQLGTPAYMSPEQVRGEHEIDARTDVWAAGVVLLELLTGRMLFSGPSDAVIFVQILNRPEELIAAAVEPLPAALGEVITRALRSEQDERYASMQAFRHALELACGRSPELSDLGEPPEAYAMWTSPGHFADVPEAASPATRTDSVTRRAAQLDEDDPRDEQDDEEQDEVSRYAQEAMRALQLNILDDALTAAQRVIDESSSDSQRAHMQLIQAIAHHWLGNFGACQLAAQQAMAHFPRGRTGWFVALGHVATAAGYLGRFDELDNLADELRMPVQNDNVRPAHSVAACRLTHSLLRAGQYRQAEELFASVVISSEDHDALVHAWHAVVRSGLALSAGDPSAYMTHVERAVELFTLKGDVRNACTQQHNLGDAFMRLGAYARANRTLSEVLAIAEPMRLALVVPTRINLGFALARLGRLEDAQEVVLIGLRQAVEQGQRRLEAYGNVHLALILAGLDELDAAEAAARQGIACATISPALEAYAHAILGGVLLMQEREKDALMSASQAATLLRLLKGVEEGEALIQLVFATALASTGKHERARHALSDACERLHERSLKITDRGWRRSFLENVPENARILDIAQKWLDEGAIHPRAGKRVARTILGLGGGVARAR